MTFIRTSCGLINANSINRIEKTNSGYGRIYTDTIDTTSLDNFDDLEDKLSVIVNNRTEIQAVKFHPSNDTFNYEVSPIIAWRITEYGPIPITLDATDVDAYLLPTGEVKLTDGTVYKNIDAARTEYNRQFDWAITFKTI